MREQQAIAAAKARLKEHAVKFGEERRYDNMRAYPFFYNFIPYPFVQGIVNDATGQYDVSAADAEGPDGLAIAAGGIRDIPIVMDRDTNFHLLSIRYGAWNPDMEAPNTGSRARLLPPNTSLQGGRSMFQAQMNQMDFYSTYLDVSVFMVSSGARDLYGGMQRNPVTGAREELPIPVQALQGVQDGCGTVRTAFQLPKSATVSIRIVNNFGNTLRVYGHLFGYKITI